MTTSIQLWSFHYRKELSDMYQYLKSVDPFFIYECNYTTFVQFCYDHTSNHKLL